MLPELLGGIGLFLLGIVLLTDSLRSLSGRRLREAMVRLAGTPWRAFGTSVGITAVIQSASATIIMMLGLRAAGLLSATAGVAIILGSNLGGTSTAWLVALFGLRFSVSTVALPLIAVGALMRLVNREGIGLAGLALAGFGVLFVGIDLLQTGMQSLAPDLRSVLPSPDSARGALALVLVGVILTTAVQSSSVTVATTLAAVHAGAVGLESGGLLVIGQNLGTTVTTVIAGLGTSTVGRRAAVAHVGMNGISGVVVLVLFTPALALAQWSALPFGGSDVVALAAFFTLLNGANALIFMPIAGRVAGIAERVVPERRAGVDVHLDDAAAAVPEAGVEAARRALAEVGTQAVGVLRARMEQEGMARATRRRLEEARRSWFRIEEFLAGLGAAPADKEPASRHLMLALDHLDALLDGGAKEPLHASAFASDSLRAPVTRMRDALDAAAAWLQGPMDEEPAVAGLAEAIEALQRQQRPQVITAVATADADVGDAMHRLEALHWLAGIARPLERFTYHLALPDDD